MLCVLDKTKFGHLLVVIRIVVRHIQRGRMFETFNQDAGRVRSDQSARPDEHVEPARLCPIHRLFKHRVHSLLILRGFEKAEKGLVGFGVLIMAVILHYAHTSQHLPL